MQVISLGPDLALEDFCNRVRVCTINAFQVEDLPDYVIHAYLNLLARYEISYQPADLRGGIKVRLCHPQASGETIIEVVQRPVAGSELGKPRTAGN